MSKDSPAIRSKCALLLCDVQEKLLERMPEAQRLLHTMKLLCQAWHILRLPTLVTEQYPEGLGKTPSTLIEPFSSLPVPLSKTAFSAMREPSLRHRILSTPCDQWLIVGLEAHICVLQTARDLKAAGKYPIVLRDAVTSATDFLKESAFEELRREGIRLACIETILFEIVENAQDGDFKTLLPILKELREHYV